MRALVTPILLLTLFLAPASFATMPPQVGEAAPNWILTSADGERLVFYRDADAQQVVMLFWATWCPYCRDLLPKLEALRAELADYPIKFYALNVWEDGEPEEYFKNNGYGLKLLLQAEPVAQRWGVVGTPGLFVMDADKNITYIRQRGTSNDDAIIAVRNALGLEPSNVKVSAATDTVED